MSCKNCNDRGKTWNGSDPKCAFESGLFDTDNWNCETMNKLRDLVRGVSVYNEDTYCAVLPVFDCGEFLLISHYKNRGRTEGAFIVDEDKVTPLTLKEAETIIDQYKDGTMRRNCFRPDAY